MKCFLEEFRVAGSQVEVSSLCQVKESYLWTGVGRGASPKSSLARTCSPELDIFNLLPVRIHFESAILEQHTGRRKGEEIY